MNRTVMIKKRIPDKCSEFGAERSALFLMLSFMGRANIFIVAELVPMHEDSHVVYVVIFSHSSQMNNVLSPEMRNEYSFINVFEEQ